MPIAQDASLGDEPNMGSILPRHILFCHDWTTKRNNSIPYRGLSSFCPRNMRNDAHHFIYQQLQWAMATINLPHERKHDKMSNDLCWNSAYANQPEWPTRRQNMQESNLCLYNVVGTKVASSFIANKLFNALKADSQPLCGKNKASFCMMRCVFFWTKAWICTSGTWDK